MGVAAHPIGRFSWPQKLMALARITSLRAEVRPMETDRRISESTGAELSIASPWRVPKLGKRLSESKPSHHRAGLLHENHMIVRLGD